MVTVKNMNVCARLQNYTTVVLCEVDSIQNVKDSLKGAGYCEIDIAFYYIEDAKSDSRTLTQAVYPMVIGYWSSDNRLRRNMVTAASSSPKQRHNLWTCKKPTLDRDGDGVVINAEQKVVELMESIITTFSFEREWVLDACCGTGSAVIAALSVKRNAVGIDLDKRQTDHTEMKVEGYCLECDGDITMEDVESCE
ncbi:uncharacterized protein [Ptychodera flava]|uniref:uncharacterized protein n=1 Tax=Ptychodera flava TaxID=63121 RepID=UPI00396A4A6E